MKRISFATASLMAVLAATNMSNARTVQGAQAGSIHVVNFVIERNGRVLGTPQLTLRENTPAEIRVDGQTGYVLGVTLSRAKVDGRSVAHLATSLSLPSNGTFEQVATPSITMPFAGSASIDIGSGAASANAIRLKATIDAEA